jgi:hypothetical protein
VYTPSPLVVVRDMGWRHRGLLLAVDTVMMRLYQYEAGAALLISLLAARASTITALHKTARRRGLRRNIEWTREMVHSMKEDGILVICQLSETEAAMAAHPGARDSYSEPAGPASLVPVFDLPQPAQDLGT